jgi:hypothetical protein
LSNDASAAGGLARPAVACFLISFAFLLITHLRFLRLPYHWDELGYFIPAAHDLFAYGAVAPRSTPPNVHPPLLMFYLAAVWKLFGFSIAATRTAMLAVGAGAITAAYLLSRQVVPGKRPAWITAALLAVSPVFVAQTMLAQLDLPAALLAAATLYLFLSNRPWWCGLAASALVMTKETGVLAPAVLLFFSRRNRKQTVALLMPFVALGGWLIVVRATTGHWLGNPAFAAYNTATILNPGRVLAAACRRCYQLAFADFRWLATAVVGFAAIRRGGFQTGAWKLIAAVVAAYLAFHSVLGGAVLLRYLLPVLPLFYMAAAAAMEGLPPALRGGIFAALLAGIAVSNWWNPPYPFAYEDNLAVIDFIRLQQQAADWLSAHASGRTVTTAWPLTDALSNPLCGYVRRPVRVNAIEDFTASARERIAGQPDIVAIYSRNWEPAHGWQNWPPLARALQRYFFYAPQAPAEQWAAKFSLRLAARWERRGQWMAILAR